MALFRSCCSRAALRCSQMLQARTLTLPRVVGDFTARAPRVGLEAAVASSRTDGISSAESLGVDSVASVMVTVESSSTLAVSAWPSSGMTGKALSRVVRRCGGLGPCAAQASFCSRVCEGCAQSLRTQRVPELWDQAHFFMPHLLQASRGAVCCVRCVDGAWSRCQ